MNDVILTGARGYVGSVLNKMLATENLNVNAIDLDWFSESSVHLKKNIPASDFSEVSDEQLSNCKVLIHLAAVSNDPMGDKFNSFTVQNNVSKVVELFRRCSEAGVPRVIFASSCSVFGTRGYGTKTEQTVPNPLTTYAKSKVEIEKLMFEISQLTSNSTEFIALRFATAAGPSGNFRVDLVLNDFVWSAVSRRAIKIMSDGTPLRPIIDVRDMAKAINWARLERFDKKFELFNVGSNQNNFSVLELAELVRSQVSNVKIQIFGERADDQRSYEVSFDRFQSRVDFGFIPIGQTIADLENQVHSLLHDGYEKETFNRLQALSRIVGN